MDVTIIKGQIILLFFHICFPLFVFCRMPPMFVRFQHFVIKYKVFNIHFNAQLANYIQNHDKHVFKSTAH